MSFLCVHGVAQVQPAVFQEGLVNQFRRGAGMQTGHTFWAVVRTRLPATFSPLDPPPGSLGAKQPHPTVRKEISPSLELHSLPRLLIMQGAWTRGKGTS